MTYELMPLNTQCNIKCEYCYQEGLRENEEDKPYSMERMREALLRQGQKFMVFGGEPLLVPIGDLEEIFKLGLEKYGSNGIQTNGSLITDAHIALFKRYSVSVGISLDGPGELNDARRIGDLESTRRTTERSEANLLRCMEEKVCRGVIVTLHKLNARPDRLPRLVEWIKFLCDKGMTSVRFHALEIDSAVAEMLALSEDDAVAAMLTLRELCIEKDLIVHEFADIAALLRGQDKGASCIWNGCDPWTTPAVSALDGQGERKNCGRTNKDGKSWMKASSPGHMRQLILYNTPYEDGGCKGCRFFVMCKGNCPGHGIDGDWRSRPRDCRVWMRLFEETEATMLRLGQKPVSKWTNLAKLEEVMLKEWAAGRQPIVEDGIAILNGKKPAYSSGPGGHIDWHKDHNDASGANQ